MRSRALLIVAAVLTAAIVPYLRVLPAWFVADDYVFIPAYAARQDGIWQFAWNAIARMRDVPTSFYRPLPFISLFAEARAWGAVPLGFHATNLLLHAGTTLLVFLVARRLAGSGSQAAPGAAAAGALFFAAHPRRVEAVAWISCRPDLLCGLFAIAMVASWLRWIENNRSFWRIVSVAAWWAAVLSKETAVLLPLALLALPRKTGVGFSPRGLWPFAVSLPAYLLLRHAALGQWVGGYGAEVFTTRRVVLGFPKHLLYGIAPPLEFVDRVDVSFAIALGCVIGAAVLALARAAWRLRGAPAVRFAAAWAGMAILPACVLPVSLATTFNDRFFYLPAAGLAVALADWLARTDAFRRAIAIAVLVLLAAHTALIAERWRTAGALTEHIASDLAKTVGWGLGTRDAGLDAAPVYLAAVPDSYRGAYMLRSGVREAVRLKGGVGADRLMPMTRYFLTSTGEVPVAAALDGGAVVVRGVGGPALLPFESPVVPVEFSGAADRFGRRQEARFNVPAGSDVFVVGPKGRARPGLAQLHGRLVRAAAPELRAAIPVHRALHRDRLR